MMRFTSSALLVFVFLSVSCSRNIPIRMEFVLGTVCSVNLFERGKAAEYDAIFARLREIQAVMSANIEGTDLDAINKNAGIRAVAVPKELLEVLEAAQRYAELSGGAFDPTIGPLVKLWGIGGEDPRIPGTDEIGAALSLVDWQDLVIDRDAGTAFLRRPGQSLDLGAIAKGYAADQAAAILPKNRRAIIDLGGNIFALGERSGNESWRIG
ncbi:MAG: FAD:protein FMN transferase, partial [Treponema sp.]|nr:FAD:protein FMN transferase [Treponema sp.]